MSRCQVELYNAQIGITKTVNTTRFDVDHHWPPRISIYTCHLIYNMSRNSSKTESAASSVKNITHTATLYNARHTPRVHLIERIMWTK